MPVWNPWRPAAWAMIRARQDVRFTIITKRIVRFLDCVPPDWGDGWPNITVGCTVESQRQADIRLPIFTSAPIRHRFIICEPLLERIDLSLYLGPKIGYVTVGGESGPDARVCDYDWVLDIRRQCIEKNVPFDFKQTGARFRKNGKIYAVPRKYQADQAKKAAIDT